MLTEPKKDIKIVQLGDSFSAGNGARAPGKSAERNYDGICFRSPTNWGSRYAQRLMNYDNIVDNVTYINRACGASFISSIVQPFLVTTETDTMCDDVVVDYPNEEYLIQNGDDCERYVNPQIDIIDETVDIVLMTFGGNEFFIFSLLVACVSPIANEEQCLGAFAFANSVFEGGEIEIAMRDVLVAIGSRMRNDAKIVLVGYPHVLLEEPKFFFAGIDVTTELRNFAIRGDEIQQNVVDAANAILEQDNSNKIEFCGIKSIFDMHEGNPLGPDIVPENINPIGWLWEFQPDLILLDENYHFNPKGHKKLGKKLDKKRAAFGLLGLNRNRNKE